MIVPLVTGLILVHLLWAYFFVLGRLTLSTLSRNERSGDRDERFVEIVVDIGVGAAESMFSLFLLGQAGLLTAPGISIAALVLVASAFAVRLRQTGSFERIARDLGSPPAACFEWGSIASYGIAFPTVTLALLPPTAFDSTMYHLAHAIDWAHDGGIAVDPFLRFPLFAYNYELIYALFFAFHLDPYVHFATWISFATSTAAAYGLTRLVLVRMGISHLWSTLGGLGASVSLAAYPTALAFANVGYIDVPAGFMFAAAVSAAVLALERPARWTAALAICGGSFVGFKLPLFGYVPLFVLLILIVCRKNVRPRAFVNCFVLVVFALPWYAYNFAVAGDPISPTLNIIVKRADPYWSTADYYPVVALMHQGNMLDTLLRPMKLLIGGEALAYSVLLLYVPIVALALRLLGRERKPAAGTLIDLTTTYAIAAAVVTSTMTGRYTLQFYAVFLVAMTVALFRLASWASANRRTTARRAAYAAVVVVELALALPSTAGTAVFAQIAEQEGMVAPAVMQPVRYLDANMNGFTAANDLATIERLSGRGGRVLGTSFENTAYYFRRLDVVSVGDWFGPGRYADLKAAIDGRSLRAYLIRLDIDAAMFIDEPGPQAAGDFLTPEETKSFIRQLTAAGFVDHSHAGSGVREYVRRDVLAKAFSMGYRSGQT